MVQSWYYEYIRYDYIASGREPPREVSRGLLQDTWFTVTYCYMHRSTVALLYQFLSPTTLNLMAVYQLGSYGNSKVIHLGCKTGIMNVPEHLPSSILVLIRVIIENASEVLVYYYYCCCCCCCCCYYYYDQHHHHHHHSI